MFDCDYKRNSLVLFVRTRHTLTFPFSDHFLSLQSWEWTETVPLLSLCLAPLWSAWSTDCVLSPYWCILDCLLRADSAERSGCHLAVSHCWPIRCWGGEQLGRRLIYRKGLESSHWVKSRPVLQITQECIDSVRCLTITLLVFHLCNIHTSLKSNLHSSFL